MLSDQLFDGSFNLNGKTLLGTIKIATSESYLSVRPAEHRYGLSLDLFSPRILILSDDDTLLSGAQYILKGPRVAHLVHGPLGHPGDGEYDHWYFSEFVFTFRFTRNTFEVELTGESEAGISGSRTFASTAPIEDIPSQSVQVSFVVPQSKMKGFLLITDEGWLHYQKRIDSLFRKEQLRAHMPS